MRLVYPLSKAVSTFILHPNHSLEDKDLISEGIMYTLMVNSKASTFQEFYSYLMNNYISKDSDKNLQNKLINAMKINGINRDGSFMLSDNVLRGYSETIEESLETDQQITDSN